MGTRERRLRSNERDLLISSLFVASGADSEKMAIAAVGSFGRGELAPGSDLDIVILHNGSYSQERLSEIVNSILYPLWDKKIKVDHSVRTRNEVREALSEDLKVAMGLLDIRLICGSADLVADMRFLENPHWDPQLRPLNGLDAQVSEAVLQSAAAQQFLTLYENLVSTMRPGYLTEGKRYMTIAVGCTGGKHRSVAMAEELAGKLRAQGIQTLVLHRDLGRE